MCTMEMERPKRKITMICAYAPTLPVSEKQPQIREDFYNELESLINSISGRNTLVVAGNFNLKQEPALDFTLKHGRIR